jgi:hypothetical protein
MGHDTGAGERGSGAGSDAGRAHAVAWLGRWFDRGVQVMNSGTLSIYVCIYI